MTILYHNLHSGLGYTYIHRGSPYLGSDREYLSKLLGGLVGFAYAYLPNSWQENPSYNHYEIHIPDEALVFLGKDYHDIPREKDEDWDGKCTLVTAKEAVELCSTPGHSYTEVAFLASDATFGNPLHNLLKDAEEVLGVEFDTPQEALENIVSKILSLGLEEKELASMYTGESFIGLNLPYPDERYESLIHSYAHRDFSSVYEWLMNKPHVAVYLLRNTDWIRG